ncbi:MAG: hypothetical protein L0H59_15905, partial [Tomitella sp.]|nr:hypothetical protein [Tomitella sp.]
MSTTTVADTASPCPLDKPAYISGQLRRNLAWRSQGLDSFFHATEDQQVVRDAVFDVIRKHDFSFYATM